MAIMKKRNAVLGWAVWKLGKRAIKRKAKAVVPGTSTGGGRAAKPALLAGAAALGGALLFWRRKSGDDETPET
jgi:LPXTG-motif cell wall-anchored protein